MISVELAQLAGCTYRQLDVWTRAGWVRAEPIPEDYARKAREYPDSEVKVAVRMAQLVRLGLTVPVAGMSARSWFQNGAYLGEGMFIDYRPTIPEEAVDIGSVEGRRHLLAEAEQETGVTRI